jgi:hypothetical protein
MFQLHMSIILFTIDLYINNFVECQIFLFHKMKCSMIINLLVSLIHFFKFQGQMSHSVELLIQDT